MPPSPNSSPARCGTFALACACGLVWAAACAGAPVRSSLRGATVLLEVLPRSAEVWADDSPLGPGAREVLISGAPGEHLFRAAAEGFLAGELRAEAGSLDGARLGLVLRPEGFDALVPLDLDEPRGLALASAFLAARESFQAAAEYAGRSVELAPWAPLPHRVLGDAYSALGQRRRARREYAAYLETGGPGVPDLAEVELRMERLGPEVDVDARAGAGGERHGP